MEMLPKFFKTLMVCEHLCVCVYVRMYEWVQDKWAPAVFFSLSPEEPCGQVGYEEAGGGVSTFS